MMSDEHSLVSTVSDGIVNHPLALVVVFLLITAGFATGLTAISMEGGTDQFSEDVEAYQTNEYVEETFGSSFEDDTDMTMLLQDASNVLSKERLLEMLRVQQDLSERPSQRVVETTSPAKLVALELDPTATTIEDQRRAIRTATDTEVRKAIRAKSVDPAFTRLVGDDFNSRAASASAALGVISHDANEDDELIEEIQIEAQRIASTSPGNIRVFGTGITNHENTKVLRESLAASIPTVIILLLIFLAVAYRDPFDLLLGILGLAMALVWTFGFVGIAGIPFTQLQVALPPLLMAIGVDFGIHVINRYREELEESPEKSASDASDIEGATRRAIGSLLMAFFMVLGTSVIGFSANMASGLSPIADFGLVASVGIVAVMLIFGIFLPAAKLLVERLRRRTRLPSFTSTPLGSEDSILGRILPYHIEVTGRIPVLVLIIVLIGAGAAGYYGQDVGSSFEKEDMLPPEELPGYLDYLPAGMQPGSYTVTENIHFLEENFETTDDDTVTIYLEGSLAEDHVLESIYRAGRDPPTSFISDENNRAEATSILSVIQSYAEQNPEFATLVERNDRNSNGVPDRDLDRIYDELLTSPMGDRAEQYVTDDRREMRIVYSVETDATDAAVTEDAESMAASSFRNEAIETGDVVVFQRVSEEVFDSAVSALMLALSFAFVFLTLLYYALRRRPALGVVTLFPIAITVLFLVATMRYLGIPFNTLTATILSVTVGIGIDYSIHIVHRFVEEYDRMDDEFDAARITLQGTGGALFGTTLTTASAGIALYYLSITPILIQFGVLIAISVTYSFIASTVVLPVVLVLWVKWESVRDVARNTLDGVIIGE